MDESVAAHEEAPWILAELSISTFTYNYLIRICPDGTGSVFATEALRDDGTLDPAHERDGTEFEHPFVGTAFEELRQNPQRSEAIVDWFTSEGNSQLDDPFLIGQEWWGEGDVHFTLGSHDELDRLMRMFILTDPEIGQDAGNACFTIWSGESEDQPSFLDEGDSWNERMTDLITLALNEHQFAGLGQLQYNDAAYDQESGYSRSDLCISYDAASIMETASSREKMQARADLTQWLTARGKDPQDYLAPAIVLPKANASIMGFLAA